MRFIKKNYFLLYPALAALVGAYLGYHNDDIQAGTLDGLVLGSLWAIWSWIGRFGFDIHV
jgi:hypothetical protein